MTFYLPLNSERPPTQCSMTLSTRTLMKWIQMGYLLQLPYCPSHLSTRPMTLSLIGWWVGCVYLMELHSCLTVSKNHLNMITLVRLLHKGNSYTISPGASAAVLNWCWILTSGVAVMLLHCSVVCRCVVFHGAVSVCVSGHTMVLCCRACVFVMFLCSIVAVVIHWVCCGPVSVIDIGICCIDEQLCFCGLRH